MKMVEFLYTLIGILLGLLCGFWFGWRAGYRVAWREIVGRAINTVAGIRKGTK